jgi:hypothetical protein
MGIELSPVVVIVVIFVFLLFLACAVAKLFPSV